LFEKTERSVSESSEEIENSLNNLIWDRLDSAVSKVLKEITLDDLVSEAEKNTSGEQFMFYI